MTILSSEYKSLVIGSGERRVLTGPGGRSYYVLKGVIEFKELVSEAEASELLNTIRVHMINGTFTKGVYTETVKDEFDNCIEVKVDDEKTVFVIEDNESED